MCYLQAKIWPGYGKNDQDVAQLWIGFLDFYCQKFEYKSYVVSIRQLRKMSKFEKLWNSDTLAIEDPFDLKRNLGSALSKKSEQFMVYAFTLIVLNFYSGSTLVPHQFYFVLLFLNYKLFKFFSLLLYDTFYFIVVLI